MVKESVFRLSPMFDALHKDQILLDMKVNITARGMTET